MKSQMAYTLLQSKIHYIDIPKTSSTWIKIVLRQREPGTNYDALTHGLPVHWDGFEVFTVVREPASWLASVFAHRVRDNWSKYPRRVPWQMLLQVLEPYESRKFGKFIEKISQKLPGVVGWFYGIYTPPGVRVLRMEDEIYPYLEYELGLDPYKVEKHNVGFKVPEVTDEIREIVRKSEANTYARYGYE